jgi:hypothetical protein
MMFDQENGNNHPVREAGFIRLRFTNNWLGIETVANVFTRPSTPICVRATMHTFE